MSDEFGPFIISRRTYGSGAAFAEVHTSTKDERSWDDAATPPAAGFEYKLGQETVNHVVVPYNDVHLSVPGTPIFLRALLPGTQSKVRPIRVDSSGRIVAAGFFAGTVNFGNGDVNSVGGLSNGFLAKYNENNLVWLKTFGSGDTCIVHGMAVDSNDNVVVTGLFRGDLNLGTQTLHTTGSYDAFVVKYDNASPPNIVWATAIGETFSDLGNAIAVDPSGNVLLLLSCQGTVDLGNGQSITGSAMGFAKLRASDGLALIGKGTGGTGNQIVYDIASDSNGDVWITGQTAGLEKYSGSTGNLLWSSSWATSGSTAGFGIAVRGIDQRVFVTGVFRGSVNFGNTTLNCTGAGAVLVACYENSGLPVWAFKYGLGSNSSYADFGRAIAVNDAGIMILTGEAPSGLMFLGSGYIQGKGYYVAGYLLSGNNNPQWKWEYCLSGSGAGGGGQSVVIDNLGNAIVGGYFTGTTQFGGGLNATATSSNGNGFFVKYTA